MTVFESRAIHLVGLSIVGALIVKGCSKPPVASTLPNAPAAVPPRARVFNQILVRVSDTTWRPVADATVEILNLAGAPASAISNADGSVRFSGTFSGVITVRAAKEGFVSGTRSLDLQTVSPPTSAPYVQIFLESVTPSIDLSGDYTLTFVANSTCDVPADIRMRTYAAKVTPNHIAGIPEHTQYRVTVDGTTTWCCGDKGQIGIGVAGDRVAVTDDTSDQVLEHVQPFRYLEFSIWGETSVTSPASPLSFTGWLDYCDLKSDIVNTFCRFVPAALVNTRLWCQKDSEFRLTRR
jgi:hypothetical protein